MTDRVIHSVAKSGTTSITTPYSYYENTQGTPEINSAHAGDTGWLVGVNDTGDYCITTTDNTASDLGHALETSENPLFCVNPSGDVTYGGDLNVGGNLNVTGDTVLNGDLIVNGTNDVTIGGNLTVNGTTTTVNTEELTIKDPKIELGLAKPVDLEGATVDDSVDGQVTFTLASGTHELSASDTVVIRGITGDITTSTPFVNDVTYTVSAAPSTTVFTIAVAGLIAANATLTTPAPSGARAFITTTLNPDEAGIRVFCLNGSSLVTKAICNVPGDNNVVSPSQRVWDHSHAITINDGTNQVTVLGDNLLRGDDNLGITGDAGITNTSTGGTYKVDASGQIIDMDAATVDVDSTGAVSIDAGAASNFTTSVGEITVNGATGVNIQGNASEVDVTTTGALDMNAGSATLDTTTSFTVTTGTVFDVDATGAATIDAGAASNFTTSAGALTLSTSAAGDDVNVTATLGGVNVQATTQNADGTINIDSGYDSHFIMTANDPGNRVLEVCAKNQDVTTGTAELKLCADDNVNVEAPAINLTGAVSITGDVNMAGCIFSENNLPIRIAPDEITKTNGSDATIRGVIISHDCTQNPRTISAGVDYLLDVDGDIICESVTSVSDARYKTNVVELKNATEKVMKLRPVNYNFKETEGRNFDTKRLELGFIAQEVEEVIPEVVRTEAGGEQYKSLVYDRLTAVLVKTCQEQEERIRRLEALVEKLSA